MAFVETLASLGYNLEPLLKKVVYKNFDEYFLGFIMFVVFNQTK